MLSIGVTVLRESNPAIDGSKASTSAMLAARGTSEYTHGLLRPFFPKSTNSRDVNLNVPIHN